MALFNLSQYNRWQIKGIQNYQWNVDTKESILLLFRFGFVVCIVFVRLSVPGLHKNRHSIQYKSIEFEVKYVRVCFLFFVAFVEMQCGKVSSFFPFICMYTNIHEWYSSTNNLYERVEIVIYGIHETSSIMLLIELILDRIWCHCIVSSIDENLKLKWKLRIQGVKWVSRHQQQQPLTA